MRTIDDAYVSILTEMCEHHTEQFALLAAQVLDAPTDDYPGGASDRLDHLRQYLDEERAACVENCGRVDD